MTEETRLSIEQMTGTIEDVEKLDEQGGHRRSTRLKRKQENTYSRLLQEQDTKNDSQKKQSS